MPARLSYAKISACSRLGELQRERLDRIRGLGNNIQLDQCSITSLIDSLLKGATTKMKNRLRINRRSSLTLVASLIILILVFSISVDVVNGSAGAVPSQSSPARVAGAGTYHLASWEAGSGKYVYFASPISATVTRPEQDNFYELPLVLK